MNDYETGEKEYQRVQDANERGSDEADEREHLLTEDKSAATASTHAERDDDAEQEHDGTRHQLRRARLLHRLRLVLGLAFLLTAGALALFLSNYGCGRSPTSSAALQGSSTGDGKLSTLKVSKKSVVFGLGIGDITGPIVGVNMMGYAALPQTNTGLHVRERSRAYIVGSLDSKAPSREEAASIIALAKRDEDDSVDPADGDPSRWIFVISDFCMGDTAVRRAVVDQLRDGFPGLYGERNFAWVGTHSHSGVGGYINALTPTITSGGIVEQSFNAIVDGTVRAIVRAHEDYEGRRERLLKGGDRLSVSFGNTTLRDAHINRSKFSYALNPAAERAMYDSDLDDEFALLRFDEGSKPQGLLSWYAVHGTSLYENNTLTSGDNKGLAAVLYETKVQPDLMPGNNTFIAGFSQASVGDTSPNTLGALCVDGSPCDNQHSTCPTDRGVKTPFGPNVTVSTCLGRGPGFGDDEALAQSPTGSYDWKSNQIIAQKQVDAAQEVMGRPLKKLAHLEGVVNSVKLNVDMSQFAFTLQNGTAVQTCPAALGYGFAGGTTDGPGVADFKQGQNSSDPHNGLWDVIRFFFKQPSAEQMACQAPKRVLLDIGNQHRPYDWAPSVVETQILQVGNMFVLVVPGEFTTMAGRRLKEAVRVAVRKVGLLQDGQEPIVVIAGPANTYSHYITTSEEYTAQRYEGGSTLFGPNTLEAYLYIYSNMLVPALRPGAGKLEKGPLATINIEKAFKAGRRKSADTAPWGKSFGDVIEQPQEFYTMPTSKSDPPANVTATFVAASPANDLRLERTYLEIQIFDPPTMLWKTVRTDSHPSTTMRWTSTGSLGTSKVEFGWAVERGTPAGRYRMVYWGDSKTPFTGSLKEFSGYTADFNLS
ncbi:hypothetical protein A4X13_0g7402 [Tilletia indica]|uniref:Neutral ceramidase n=1 Tax=Tilletia indica TaxID=43049 RepID=A0A177T7B7_9BASI|nr:hypothetical protein A4X13_0g7402 [Tilletia indica]